MSVDSITANHGISESRQEEEFAKALSKNKRFNPVGAHPCGRPKPTDRYFFAYA